MQGHSLDLTQDLLAQLKALVPQAFTEDQLDVAQLKTLLGETAFADGERYGLSWAGKTEAYKVLQRPTTATLIPNPEDSEEWENAPHVLIEGENLEVLKVLQKSYYGKVKMIYIDPPYNTGNDSFIYPDKFSETKEEYLRRIGDKDEEGRMMKQGFFRKNSKENGQFHSNWLNMMLPRLFLARNLLKEDGVIFVSIDDNEQANLKLLMDEIFGEENFVANIVWQKKYATSNDAKGISAMHDHILVFKKTSLFERNLFPRTEKQDALYKNDDGDGKGLWRTDNLLVKSFSESYVFPIENPNTGESFLPPQGSCWRASKETISLWLSENRIFFGKDGKGRPQLKRYLNEVQQGVVPSTWWGFDDFGHNDEANKDLKKVFETFIPFDTPKPTRLIKRILQLSTTSKQNDIVLDFFAGSGTLAQAVLELNEEDGGKRQYICVQLPEATDEKSEAYKAGYKSIAEITQARIKKVIAQIKAKRNGALEFDKFPLLGFRKYTLASSNFKIWRGDVLETEEDLLRQMDMFTTPQRPESQTENILWELLIKNGIPLTEAIQTIVLEDGISKIYHTPNKRFAFVLDHFTQAVQDEVLQLAPKTVICLDSLFKGRDTDKTNAQLKFEDNGITFKTV